MRLMSFPGVIYKLIIVIVGWWSGLEGVTQSVDLDGWNREDRELIDKTVSFVYGLLHQKPRDPLAGTLIQVLQRLQITHSELPFLQAYWESGKQPDPPRVSVSSDALITSFLQRASYWFSVAKQSCQEVAYLSLLWCRIAELIDPNHFKIAILIETLTAFKVVGTLEELVTREWNWKEIMNPRIEKTFPLVLPKRELQPADERLGKILSKVAYLQLREGQEKIGYGCFVLARNLVPLDPLVLYIQVIYKRKFSFEDPKRLFDLDSVPSLDQLVVELLKRVKELRTLEEEKRWDTRALRTAYLRVVELIRPESVELTRELAMVGVDWQQKTLTMLTEKPLDCLGIIEENEFSRCIQIWDEVYRIRQDSIRRQIQRRWGITYTMDKAVERSCEYLLQKQASNGSWNEDPVVTAWVLWLYLIRGHLPTSALYGKAIEKGIQWLFHSASEMFRSPRLSSFTLVSLVQIMLEIYATTGDVRSQKMAQEGVSLLLNYLQRNDGILLAESSRSMADIWTTMLAAGTLTTAIHFKIQSEQCQSTLKMMGFSIKNTYCRMSEQRFFLGITHSIFQENNRTLGLTPDCFGLGTCLAPILVYTQHEKKLAQEWDEIIREGYKLFNKTRLNQIKKIIRTKEAPSYLAKELPLLFGDTVTIFLFTRQNRLLWDEWIRLFDDILLLLYNQKTGEWTMLAPPMFPANSVFSTAFVSIMYQIPYVYPVWNK